MYAFIPAALPLLFSSHQQLLVPAIWKAIRDIGGRELVCEVIKYSAAEMVKHYQPRITGRTAEGRVLQMAKLLEEKGHIVEVECDEQGVIVLRNRSCPFISMLDKGRFVCRVGFLTISKLCKCRLRQVASRLDGAPCCVFEIRTDASKSGDYLTK